MSDETVKAASAMTQRRRTGQAVDLSEIGTTGLRHYGGFVAEEWLRQLSGRRGIRVWREMSDNDPVIGAILFAIKMLARSVEATVEEGSDAAAAELVEECMQDMSSTWDDFVTEALSMLGYGWAFHEIVYKRRLGPEPKGKTQDGKPLPTSRFSDGKVGWRKLPIRAQETLWQWEFDEDDGGILAMTQVAYDGVRRTVPMEKALLFRTETTRGNPEGRSVLRNAFLPWFRKKNIEEIEAIGIERDLAGLPTLTPPTGMDLESPQNAAIKAQAQALITAIKRDEDEGVLFPQGPPAGGDGWKLELVTAGGSRQIDTDKIVRRYDQRIATTVLADFILMAQDRVGSYGLADIKVDTFGEAMGAWLGAIAEVLNRYGIPRLLRLNGMAVDEPPQIKFGEPGKADLDQLAQFLQSLYLAGAPDFWSEDLLKSLFELAGLPAPEVAAPAAKADTPEGPQAIGKELLARADALANVFDGEVHAALADVGRDVAAVYRSMVDKADIPPTDPVAEESIANKVLAAAGVEKLVKERLQPVYLRHYERVMRDTVRTIKQQIDLATDLPDLAARRILRDGGTRLGMLDIEKQTRTAIMRALTEGRTSGDGPLAIAKRIEQYVPAGRFVKAGSGYRSRLIARTETLNAQRDSALELYKAAPNVTAVILSDGLLSSSDSICAARNGDEVSFEEAAALMQDEHPLGTLAFSPLVA